MWHISFSRNLKTTNDMKIGKIVFRFQSPIVVDSIDGTKTTYADFGTAIFMPTKAGVKHFLKEEKRLMAIKFYKYRSGKGLKDSKDYVDKLELKLYPDVVKKRQEQFKQTIAAVEKEQEKYQDQVNNN